MKHWVRNSAAALMILAMAGTAALTGEQEIIFPEVLALAVGMWVADRQPWRVTPVCFVLLMAGASLFGMLLVRFLPVPLILKVGIAFLFTVVLLTVTKTTFYPIISACVLPVLLGTESLVYPVSVLAMAVVIVLVQKLLEWLGLREKAEIVKTPAGKPELKKWGVLFLLFLALAVLPLQMKAYYFIAPPLIVTFVEFSEVGSKKREMPIRVWCTIVLCAVFGTGCRLFLQEAAGLSVAFTAAAAALMVLITFRCVRMIFPPAGAIALLPLLLPAETLWLYPLETAIGAGGFIAVAMLVFRQKEPAAARGRIPEAEE